MIGLPVYAAQEGWVSRIKISSFGYGNLVYINHPNGLVTTYAHLDRLEEPLAGYVLQQQYQQQVFELDLKPKRGQFQVKKGQIFAYGGNTGGSGGPHLHFEIRDTLNNLYNPLYFNFAEVADNVAPEASAIGVKPLAITSRVNQLFEWQSFKVEKLNGKMMVKDTIKASGDLGLSIEAIDKMTGTQNKNGIVEMFMAVNGELTYSFSLKKIPFDKSRHILRHTDFQVWKKSGRFFQDCYLEDGNELDIYSFAKGKGRIRVLPDSLYRVEITLRDANLNTSTVSCLIKGEKARYVSTRAAKPLKGGLSYEVIDNFLKVTAADTARSPLNASLFVGNMKYDLLPSYTKDSKTVYLYDLRAGLPARVEFCGRTLNFGFQQIVPHSTDFSFFHPAADIFFPAGALFDTLYLNYYKVKDRPALTT